MFDVVVIGGGLAGTVAALAARQAGARVALASRSWGATALSTGAIDIAYSPALSPAQQVPRTLAEHVMDISAHRPQHPYAVLSFEDVVAGVRRGYEMMAPELAASQLEPGPLSFEADNVGLPSSLGAVLPAASATAPHLGIDLNKPLSGSWGVVQLASDSYFCAERVAAGIAKDAALLTSVRPDLRVITAAYGNPMPPVALARRLDDEAEALALARALRPKVAGLAGLIFPPVLGLHRHAGVRRRLSEELGVSVVEALACVPSVPGVRLQRALDAAVGRANIARLGEIAEPLVADRQVRAVRTADKLDIAAAAFVLASGRYIAGGVSWGERCVEALFGMPVVSEVGLLEDDSPHSVVRETPVESHPLMTAGVQVGADLRPRREGRAAFGNLFAAGMVIGGFASRYALCADGVALASGWLAARQAIGVAGEQAA